MSLEKARRLLAAYEKLDHLRGCRLVSVTFRWKRQDITCYGVEYDQVFHYLPTERAVEEGKAKAGDERIERAITFIGDRPDFMKQQTRVFGMYEQKNVIQFPCDDGDWYVSSYYDQDEENEYHPVGKVFTLRRWPHEAFNQRIDHYSDKKRERVRVVHMQVDVW